MHLITGMQNKFFTIIGLFILLIMITVGATFYVVHSQSTDSTAIEIAGRQRLMALQIFNASNLLIAARESESSYEDIYQKISHTVKHFEMCLTALRDGGKTLDTEEVEVVLP